MKKRISNNTIAFLMIALMLFSLIGTTIISYRSEKGITTTGRDVTQGTVGVTIEVPTTPPGDSGAGGGGGGGGAAKKRTPVVHILDFTIQDIYIFEAYEEDSAITIFSTGNYTFDIIVVNYITTTLETAKVKFDVKTDEIVSLDLDRDGLEDLTIQYDGTNLIWTALRIPKEPLLEPIISIKKKIEEPGIPRALKEFSYLWLLIAIIAVILGLIAYQEHKLKKIERGQKKRSNVIIKVKRSKPDKKLNALERGYREGYISKDSYLKAKTKLKRR